MKPDALIAVGADGYDVPALEAARSFKMKLLAIEPDDSAEGLKLVDRQIAVDHTDSRALVAELDRLSLEHKFRGVFCFGYSGRDLTRARIASRYKLVGPSPDAVETLMSRLATFRVLQEAGVPVPEWGKAETSPQAIAVADRIKYPVLARSMSFDSSSPTRQCNNDNDLHIVFHKYPGNPFSGEVLLEHSMEGKHIIITGLVSGGEFHTFPLIEIEFYPGEAMLPEKLDMPAEVTDIQEKEAIELAKKVVGTLGIDNSPVTIEMTLGWDNPYVTNVVPNLAVDVAVGMVTAATGVDVVRECIRLSLGEKPDLELKKEYLASAMYFYPQKAGILTNIGGVEEVGEIKGVNIVDFLPQDSDVWEPVIFYDKIGKVLMTSPSRPIMDKMKKDIAEKIKISIK